eukprot:TRINITY_DN15330_c0_g1_i1.p1 TRINITY_DN15330_c0_g1~~TRINITY_DN15330_c0_g1_i1.p1  ORF type:complete len:414 (+),score=96.26 TRINITY_DN15330_c0_g1_i1:52-1242(+)
MKTLFTGMTLLLGSATADFAAPTFNVDMDKSAYDRWSPVAQYLLDTHGYNNTWGRLHTFIDDLMTQKEWEETAPLWDRVFLSYPELYREEILAYHKWITEAGHKEWTIGQLTMAQLTYEVFDACTSIVAQNTNGTIFHGRNLDYGLPGLPNMTSTITYTKGSTPVARATMYIGYAGALTGQHLNGKDTWSLSLDQRFSKIPYVETVKDILNGVQNVGFTLRDSIMRLDSYDEATSVLKSKTIPSPAYLIISGTGNEQGVVITRDRNETAKAEGTGRGFWTINTTEPNAWYRLETNFDNWSPVQDGRRTIAHAAMNKIGQSHINNEQMFNALSSEKVLNPSTTYTANMQNEIQYYHTTVREATPESYQKHVDTITKEARTQIKALLDWYRAGGADQL